LNERALKLSQFKYLKLKHLLVDLRNEQYAYRDSHSARVLSHAQADGEIYIAQDVLRIDEDACVLPLGLINPSNSLSLKIFGDPEPEQFSDEELRQISDIVWGAEKVGDGLVLDFRNPAHVYNIYVAREDLVDEAGEDP